MGSLSVVVKVSSDSSVITVPTACDLRLVVSRRMFANSLPLTMAPYVMRSALVPEPTMMAPDGGNADRLDAACTLGIATAYVEFAYFSVATRPFESYSLEREHGGRIRVIARRRRYAKINCSMRRLVLEISHSKF